MSDDHHHEAFDAEPTRELSEGEPRSPMWLPAVGIGLFAAAALIFSLKSADLPAPTGPKATESGVAAPPQASSPPQTRSPAPGAAARPTRAAPTGSRAIRATPISKDGKPVPGPVRRLPPSLKGAP